PAHSQLDPAHDPSSRGLPSIVPAGLTRPSSRKSAISLSRCWPETVFAKEHCFDQWTIAGVDLVNGRGRSPVGRRARLPLENDRRNGYWFAPPDSTISLALSITLGPARTSTKSRRGGGSAVKTASTRGVRARAAKGR